MKKLKDGIKYDLLVFLLLALVIHMVYRVKTNRFTQSWLDFIVESDGAQRKYHRIGMCDYGAILVSAIIAIVVSMMVVK